MDPSHAPQGFRSCRQEPSLCAHRHGRSAGAPASRDTGEDRVHGVLQLRVGEAMASRHRGAGNRDWAVRGSRERLPAPRGRAAAEIVKRVLATLLVGALACVRPQPATQLAPNTLSAAERAEGWRLLFNGKTLDGWRGLGYDSVPSAHWRVEDGTIRKVPSGEVARMADGQPASGGDLMTSEAFADFELSWEWRIARGGNSGVKYNVSEALSMAAAPNHAALGFEYQLLDDSLHADNLIASHRAGSLYDLIAPSSSKRLRPVG